MTWPPAYGDLLRRTKASSPRWTIRPSSSSRPAAVQKTQPLCSSADWMYSRRQGAQSRSIRAHDGPDDIRPLQPLLPAEEPDHRDERRNHDAEDHPEGDVPALAGEDHVHAEDA